MTQIRKLVEHLHTSTLMVIINQYEAFELSGTLDQLVLSKAREYLMVRNTPAYPSIIVAAARDIAFECHREYYERINTKPL